MMKTVEKTYKEGGRKYRIRAKHGMDYEFARRHKQAPYFSITVDIERQIPGGRWYDEGGGAAHDEVRRHFPALAKYIPWHLTSLEGPMHYLANAEYWYKKIGKPKERPYDPDAEEAFKHTIVFGAILGEKLPVGVPWPEVRAWLEERLPKLMDNFMADMKELGVLEG